MKSASLVFHFSWEGSMLLVDAIIINLEVVSLIDHLAHLYVIHSSVTRGHEDQFFVALIFVV